LPKLPAAAPPTEIPGPKFAWVIPFTKVVYCPVILTVTVCPALALDGFNATVGDGLIVREELLDETKVLPVEVVPSSEILYAVGEATLMELGITK
jgi:hypothetical protein